MLDTVINDLATRFGLGAKAGPLVSLVLGYITSKENGGLAGFIALLRDKGLGELASSWVGSDAGPAAVSPSLLEGALGGQDGLLSIITSRLGLPPATASSALAFLLPTVIGKLTPGGVIPDGVPAALSGFITGGASSTLSGVSSAISTEAASGGSTLRKLLPVGIVAVAAMLLFKVCGKSDVATVSVPSPVVDTAQNAATSTATDLAAAAKSAAASTASAAQAAAADTVAAANSAAAGALDAVQGSATAAADAVRTVVPAGTEGGANTAAQPSAAPTANEIPPAAKLYFDTGDTKLPANAVSLLEPIESFLKAHPSYKAQIAGFHDPRGNALKNAALALQRAKAARQALDAAGIPAGQIQMVKPVSSEGTGELAQARRVEISVVQ